MSLPLEKGIGLINICIEKELKSKLWEMWLTKYPQMTKENYVPFEEFYNKSLSSKPKEYMKSDDILKMANKIAEKVGG